MDKMRYSIVMEKNGIPYHYHGCDKWGKPQFFYGIASLSTTYYWRVYKSRKVAEREMVKASVRIKKWSNENVTFHIKEWDLNKKEE